MNTCQRNIKTISKITQDNVHLLLPNKVAQLANRLLQDNKVATMSDALHAVYSSTTYANLEQEKTKYWWLGVNALYHDIISAYSK